MCCYNHLHLLHIWNRWNTQIIRLFHEILLYSKKKKKLAGSTQLPLFTSKNGLFEPAQLHPIHLLYSYHSHRATVPLICCHDDWIRHGGAADKVTCLIPGSDSSWKFKLNLWLWECSEKRVIIIRPGPTSFDMEPWPQDPGGCSHSWSQTQAAAHSTPLPTLPAAGLGSGWEPPGCRLLIKADWFFSWWEKKDAYA